MMSEQTTCNEPFGLPKGTVRAILATLITIAVIVLAIVRPEATGAMPMALGNAFCTVIGLYFGGRISQGKQ